MKPLTFGSLFAGIGGFDLGFERVGMRCLWQVEIDAHCRKLLGSRFAGATQHTDVRAVGAAVLAPVDVITAGFPCQDLSVAGKRKGLKGARSGLFYEVVRIVTELRPRYLVWENVPGLLTSDKGRDFARVLAALADIGYFGAWRVLDARHFGVAQRRRRVFGVFARADIGAERGAEILSLAEGLRGHPPPRVEAREEVAGTLGAGSPGRGWSDDTDRATFVAGTLTRGALDGSSPCGGDGRENLLVAGTLNPGAHPGGYNGQDAHTGLLPSPTLTAKAAKAAKGTGGPAGDECQNLVAHTLSAEGADASEDGTGRGTPLVVADPLTANEAGTYCHAGNNPRPRNLVAAFIPRTRGDVGRGYERGPSFSEGMSPTIETVKPPCIAFSCKDSGDDAGELSPTLRSMNFAESHMNGGGQVAVADQRSGVRRLTPRECERLQGFPDDWTAGFSDSVRYRMLGNAVAVVCAEWIGRRLVNQEAP